MSRHFLTNIYDSGAEFPARAHELSLSFENMLSISATPYDYLLRADLIDQYVISSCKLNDAYPYIMFNSGFFQPMMAFLGEAIVRQLPGRWEAVLVETHPTNIYDMRIIDLRDLKENLYIDINSIARYMHDQCDADDFSIRNLFEYIINFPERRS